MRNASVKVESESVSLLVLTRVNFFNLIKEGKLDSEILKGVEKIENERHEKNVAVIQESVDK